MTIGQRAVKIVRRWGVDMYEPASADPPASPVATFPHCDQSILHASGECEYCDRHPDWQQLRDRWRINFTGHQDSDKAPCPSEHFRSSEARDRWYGNVAKRVTGSAP